MRGPALANLASALWASDADCVRVRKFGEQHREGFRKIMKKFEKNVPRAGDAGSLRAVRHVLTLSGHTLSIKVQPADQSPSKSSRSDHAANQPRRSESIGLTCRPPFER